MKTLASAAVLVLAALVAGTASSQEYPARPVHIVAPFAPGGGTDFIARLIAQKLTERVGQQVIVDNKPGAGGNLGSEFAVKAPPDGYTLLLVAGGYTVNPSLYKLSFDPVNDISPIIQFSQWPEELLAADGVAPAGGTPEQFRKVIGSDIGRWRGVVKQANVKVE